MTDDETNLTSLLGSASSAHYGGDEEVLSGGKGGREGGRGKGREGGGREGGRREGGRVDLRVKILKKENLYERS